MYLTQILEYLFEYIINNHEYLIDSSWSIILDRIYTELKFKVHGGKNNTCI